MSLRPSPSIQAVAQLRETAAQLDVEDILDLCFAFNDNPVRLTVYLDVLRAKGSAKSQVAACLICFDLAMQGVARFEREFLALVPVMREFLEVNTDGKRPIDALIGDGEYLVLLVERLNERLRDIDPRTEDLSADELIVDDEDIFELDVFSDDIFSEDEVDLDMADLMDLLDDTDHTMHAAWNDALTVFLLGASKSDGPAGFYADDKHQLRAIKTLRDQSASLSGKVVAAAEMRPIVEIFLAAHLRAKNLFGRPNAERNAALLTGLTTFSGLATPPIHAAAWLTDPTVAPFAWEKVAELLLDYVAFVGTQPGAQHGTAPASVIPNQKDDLAAAYLAAARPQPPPARLHVKGTARRRR